MIPPIPRSAYSTILIAFAAFAASAGTVAVPAAPVSPYADTEAVTNTAVRPSLIQRARTFSGDIALYATPSNALKVAIELMAGADPLDADENGDGIPDGVPAADWMAHPYQGAATGTTNTVLRILQAAAAGTSASVSIGRNVSNGCHHSASVVDVGGIRVSDPVTLVDMVVTAPDGPANAATR